jgi:hypothetical protein
MLLVAEEARAKGIDREVALQAQGGAERSEVAARVQPRVVGRAGGNNKGKGIVQPGIAEVEERALGWERRLSAESWRGAADLAHVTLQPACATIELRARTHALACFADGRPLVSTTERAGLEGTPDWVDNAHRAVQVMSAHGLVAPARVLLDGGSFYSMAGLSLRSQLGLTSADMDAGGHKVHTATGKVESLPGGWTKNPIPIILNKGDRRKSLCMSGLPSQTQRGTICS